MPGLYWPSPSFACLSPPHFALSPASSCYRWNRNSTGAGKRLAAQRRQFVFVWAVRAFLGQADGFIRDESCNCNHDRVGDIGCGGIDFVHARAVAIISIMGCGCRGWLRRNVDDYGVNCRKSLVSSAPWFGVRRTGGGVLIRPIDFYTYHYKNEHPGRMAICNIVHCHLIVIGGIAFIHLVDGRQT